MAETAAHLVDRVLPDVPVRHWVLTFPWRLRFLLAKGPALCRAVRRLFLRAVFRRQQRGAERTGLVDPRSGAVHFVQRFSSALNPSPHMHALVLDGVYTCASPLDQPVFHALAAPTDSGLAELCRTIRDRTLRLLARRGLPNDEEGQGSQEEPALLDAMAAASVQGRIAIGERAGRSVLRVRSDPVRGVSFAPGELCAELDGFSLHTRVRFRRGDKERLERLARYGVLAPASSWRGAIVSSPPSERRSSSTCSTARDPRYSWAELLERVFAVDVLRCADCGARRQVIAPVSREESARILAGLIGAVGDLDLAEEAIQEAFARALERWAA